MNHSIKCFYKAVNPIRHLYWRIFRPKTFGVKCLIEYNGKILMIRNTYGKKHWTIPGGKKKRKENPSVGAAREAKEEVGLNLTDLIYLGTYSSTRQFPGHKIVACR